MRYNFWPLRYISPMTKIVGWLCILVLALTVIRCRTTIPITPTPREAILGVRSLWPHQANDLAPDPQIVFGALPNGVRYILKANQTPKDRVSMHLYVQAGSLLENEQERGAAHFLEHMLFNGTKHFPPGEMVKFFQRIGMQFGPDANAHTGFDRTVYDILLPKGDSNSLSEGLMVLRDYADGALLLQDEVERERKVILAEMRSRDSAEYRTLKASFRFEMQNNLVSRRFPIGKRDTLEAMNHERLRRFYETWYRPERLFLVIVGDFDAHQVQPLIKAHFGDLQAKAPARALPDIGTLAHEGIKAFYHHENDIGSTTLAIETMRSEIRPEDSRDWQRRKLLQSLALQMLQKRLDQLVQQPDSLLTSASAAGGYYLQCLNYSEIQATSKPEHWKNALAVIEQTLRSALQHGFGISELQRAKRELKSRLKYDIQQAHTRDSKALAQQIIGALSAWTVLQSPQQIGDLLYPILESVSVEQVNRAFSDLWGADHRLLLVTGNVDLTGQPNAPESQILHVYQESRRVQVQPHPDTQVAEFPYLPIPAASGRIIDRKIFDDLGIQHVIFENGVHLYLKPTHFTDNQVLAALSFGEGQSSEPEDQPGLAKLTEAVMNESGFGEMDRITLEDALAGRLASIDLDIREDMFVIKGEAATAELPLLFQLLHTAIEDPGYREDARRLSLKRFEQGYQRLLHSTEGMMQLYGNRFLAGGDSRFGLPAWPEFKQRTLDEIRQWFGTQLRQMPLELALAGDFEPDTVIALAARYLGSLPQRQHRQTYKQRRRPEFPFGKTLELTARTDIPKALVVVAYPTDDFWEIGRTRRLAVLADLFSERLRQRVRERLGAAYSPFAFNRSYRSYSGYGVSKIFIQLDPDRISDIRKEVRFIADHMTEQPPDPDEFRRVLDPTLTQIKDLRQTNTYWLNSVLTGASRHPEQLDWSRSFADDYASITAMEITALARRYLDNRKAATVVITPEKNK